MKKFTKLFLLALCTWFLFLWFSNAQNGWYWYTYQDTSYDVSCGSFWCEINLIWLLTQKFLIWIWIVLWILLIISTMKAISLNWRLKNIQKSKYLANIPIINLYPKYKTIFWRILFFFLILFVWFFAYSLYRNIDENKCCFDAPLRQDYTWIIVWILAIIILSVLFSKLIDFHNESSKN